MYILINKNFEHFKNYFMQIHNLYDISIIFLTIPYTYMYNFKNHNRSSA